MTALSQARAASRKVGAAALVSSVACVLAGCGGETAAVDAHGDVGRTIQPIIRGEASGTAQDAVVVLATFEGGVRKKLCSATMVAPNLLITARHCVADSKASAVCKSDGTAFPGTGIPTDRVPSKLVVFVGSNGVVPDTEVEANGDAHGKKIVAGKAPSTCNADVAFVVLDTNVEAPLAPLRLRPPSVGEKVSAVGWGVDETGTLPAQRATRTGIAIMGLGPAPDPENADYGYGDSEFMIGESACSGDSGGPTLSTSGAVVGVASRAGNGKDFDPRNYAATCVGATAHAVYTHLGAHTDLVTRAFAEAGSPMWIDGEPDPRGTAPRTEGPNPPAGSAESKKKETTEPLPLPSETIPIAGGAGGCSVSPDRSSGSDAFATGFVALLASVIGRRRRDRNTI